MVINQDLYVLNTESNSFHKYVLDFIRGIGFTPTRSDQYIWIQKYDNYEGHDYISTHVDDVIINDNNPSKYMHDIEVQFKDRDINVFPKYYPGNEFL